MHSTEHSDHFSHSVFSSLGALLSRSADSSKTPLASIFALILRHALGLSRRNGSLLPRTEDLSFKDALQPISIPLAKRQTVILALPTTYAGLNSGPRPGTVVGITLGAIGGFILVLYIVLSLFQFAGRGGETIVEEEVVHRSGSPRRRSRHMSEVPRPARERVVREREDTVVVEETVEREPRSTVDDDDVVEVIEEHSPERPPRSRRTSGYRTVDPAEFGGGGRPMRKVSRRS